MSKYNYMQEHGIEKSEGIIEPEVLDEHGNVIQEEVPPRDHARPKGDNGGIIGGFFVLAFGFLMTLLVMVFSVLVLLPLALIGKLLGFQVRTFKR